ncbi:hypothetical protein [Hymenobacter gummosus]|nr:hypothetical protein [Hymenobacter gummosus]
MAAVLFSPIVPGVLPARQLLNEPPVESMPPVVAAAAVSDDEDEG